MLTSIVSRMSTVIYISDEAANSGIQDFALQFPTIANFDKRSAVVCSLDGTIDFR